MATDDLVPARTVGRYQVVAEIGRGAMGVVYRGFDPVIGRPVALKTIIVGAVAEDAEEFRQRLFREAAAAGALTHPNIVTIHDVVHDGTTTAVAMEFVEGETLAETIGRRAPLSLDEALPLFEQICSGLDYAATKGIVHRDIKPANILIGPDGRPRIADFGIARLPASTFTMSGAVLGSAGYMSPEQVRGLPLDARSDLFSAATVFYEMLTGRNPFSGTEAANTLYRIVHEMPAPIRQLNPAVPPAIESVVSRALAKDPADRYATGGEMVTALRAAASGLSAKTARSAPRSARASASTPMLVLGVVGLVGAVGVGLFMWLRPQRAAVVVATPAPTSPAAPSVAAVPPTPGNVVPSPLAKPSPRPASRASKDAGPPTASATAAASSAGNGEPTRNTPPTAPPPSTVETTAVTPPRPPVVTPTPSAPIVLAPSTPPPTAPPPLQFGSAVASVKGEVYAGVRIFLDDAQLPSPYPAQLPRLVEGNHVIKFTWTSGALAGKELTQAFDLKAGGHVLIIAVPENDSVTLRKIR